MKFQITTPKTKASEREIPMFDEVREDLLKERAKQKKARLKNVKLDGMQNFIFRNRDGDLLSPHIINRALERIINDYNEDEMDRAESEGRRPSTSVKLRLNRYSKNS